MAACVERRAACGASYNACASGATPCKFGTRQPARPAGKARADRQFQRRVSPRPRDGGPDRLLARLWLERMRAAREFATIKTALAFAGLLDETSQLVEFSGIGMYDYA